MNENLALIPESYIQEEKEEGDLLFPIFSNSEMFSLLRNNLDVMPPKFQEKLYKIEKNEETKRIKAHPEKPFLLDIDNAMKTLDSKSIVTLN